MTQDTPNIIAQDPVCHMEVDPRTAKYKSEYRGQNYYFCSRMCLKEFENEPQRRITLNPHSESYPKSEG